MILLPAPLLDKVKTWAASYIFNLALFDFLIDVVLHPSYSMLFLIYKLAQHVLMQSRLAWSFHKSSMVDLHSCPPAFTSFVGKLSSSIEFHWLASCSFGIITCKLVYSITGFISTFCFKGYEKLSNKEKVEWNNRGFSTFHALIAALASLYLLLFSDLFDEESSDELIVNRTSIISNMILGVSYEFIKHFSIGYFVSDLAMVFWHFPALGGLEYVLHHGLSMFSIFLSLISSQGQIYILMVLFSESTTPFVNLRWYLDVAGQKCSTIYVYNGIALFFGWLIARIFLFIYFFAHMLNHFDQVKNIFPLGFYSLLTVPPVLASMNVAWFWKIIKGLIKTVSKARQSIIQLIFV